MLIDINRKIKKKCLKNPLRHSRHVCQLTPALRGTYGPSKRVTANVTASRHCGAYVPSCISSIIKKTTPLLTGVRQTPTATRRGPNGGDIKTMATQAAAAKTSRAHAQKATALAVKFKRQISRRRLSPGSTFSDQTARRSHGNALQVKR